MAWLARIERQLAVLGRAAADGGGVAHFVALVLGPAEEGPVVLAEVVIDLADPVPEQVLVEVLGVVQVLLPRRDAGGDAVRRRVVLHDRARRGVDAVRRDEVARERVAHPVAVDVAAGRGVVDGDLAALRVDEAAEVAGLHRVGRHRAEEGRRRALAVLLAGEHEERLVLDDRAVDDARRTDRGSGRSWARCGRSAGTSSSRATCGGRTRIRRRGTCWCPTSATC